jgi:hypothetical protein
MERLLPSRLVGDRVHVSVRATAGEIAADMILHLLYKVWCEGYLGRWCMSLFRERRTLSRFRGDYDGTRVGAWTGCL